MNECYEKYRNHVRFGGMDKFIFMHNSANYLNKRILHSLNCSLCALYFVQDVKLLNLTMHN